MLYLYIMNILEKLFTLPEYPDYMIYPSGDIYSIRRKIFLKPRFDKDGYKRISLKNIFTLKLDTITIHNLVARCYLGYKKNSGLVIDHIDNNKLNNYIHNLQLITQSQNCRKEHMKKLQKNGLPFYIHFTPKGYIVKFLENKQKKSLGVYENIELALNARNDYFKDFFKDIKM